MQKKVQKKFNFDKEDEEYSYTNCNLGGVELKVKDMVIDFEVDKEIFRKLQEQMEKSHNILSTFYGTLPTLYFGDESIPLKSWYFNMYDGIKRKVALIYGATGQDGSYLSELLLDKGYEVVAVKRRSSISNTARIDHIKNDKFKVVEGDVTDAHSVCGLITEHKPTHVFNLAAQSHVGTSFEQPVATWDSTATGCLNILNAILSIDKTIRFYQASTSEMFGKNYSENMVETGYKTNVDSNGNITETHETVTYRYQDEETEFMPQSPYAVAKLAAHHMVRLYRESYGLFACSGILFNHESPRRGENFVTRKITKYVAKLVNWHVEKYGESFDFYDSKGFKDEYGPLELGNLDAKRDWGHAKDYCQGMIKILEHDKADDFVLATGETRSVRDFLEAAFNSYGLYYNHFVEVNPKFFRPAEVDYLKGNPTKAIEILNWKREYSFQDLVTEMVESDRKLNALQKET